MMVQDATTDVNVLNCNHKIPTKSKFMVIKIIYIDIVCSMAPIITF